MMNKKIKRMVAIVVAIGAFSAIEPSKYIQLMNTQAHAEVRGAELEKISLGKGDIDFKSKKTDYTLQLATSVDELRVGATPKEDSAEVQINGKDVDKSNNYSTIVNLDKGENTVTIDVQNGSKKKTYTITVIRGSIENTEVYLSDLKLSSGKIDFSKDTTSYDVNVPSTAQEISIEATPEDTDDDVEIDGVTAIEDKNYRRTVSLENGENKIDIRIRDDDDHEKIYTLHITRGIAAASTNAQKGQTQSGSSSSSSSASGTTSSSNSTSTAATATQTAGNKAGTAKGWLLSSGQWSYFDDNGKKATGWNNLNGVWYYLDANGAMKTGWQQVNGEWYYLDLTGAMKTGWLKNADGKWYYLYESGSMAKNTTIGGFKLDSSGSWIN